MCGIIAIQSQNSAVEPESLQKALGMMRHRGPDGQGVWLSPDGSVGLAHARLSIIDLQGGAQPLASEDGQVQAVVNGEFYDFERIRRRLQERGHRFRTGSDSEILVHLYEEHGLDCLEYLRGEFAFVLWDERRKRLFAARDRFGIKPLYYSVQRSTLRVASEAKALFASGTEAAWDPESFFHAATLQYVLPQRTLFRNVRQLPPGHYLLQEEDTLRTARYWDLDYPREKADGPASEAEQIDRFRAGLEEAVRLRLRADVPVACHLSGGLDSSAVLGFAARLSSAPVHCFTVSFDTAPYDELAIAAETARRAGAVLQEVRVSQEDLVECLPEAVSFCEGLAINGHLPAKFLLSRAIRRAGYKVVLTGEGSDEILAGYAHLRRDLMVGESDTPDEGGVLKRLAATNTVSAGIMLPHGDGLPLESVRSRLGFVPTFLEAKATFGHRMRQVLSEDFLAEHGGRDAFADLLAATDVEGQLSGRSRVDQSLYLWNKTALANYILRTLGDGTEMAHSVEGRVPFLDHPLAGLIREMPMSMKVRGGVEKYVLREAARPVLTDTVYRREKHPFLAPPLCRFSNPQVGARLEEQLRTLAPAVPFFDGRKLRQWLDRLPTLSPQERAAADPVLMTVLCTGILQQRLGLY